MQPFTTLTGVAAPLPMANVDTDKIIPARFLKSINRTGFGKNLFHSMRFREDGSENPDFVLNQPAYRNAEVLIAFENFGCGSSREHAPWALLDFGIRCVIAPDFADIFHNNCFKNGLLPIVVDEETYYQLVSLCEEAPEMRVSVDLASQTLALPGGQQVPFPIDAFAKHCLLHGVDQLGFLMSQSEAITAYEEAHPSRINTTG